MWIVAAQLLRDTFTKAFAWFLLGASFQEQDDLRKNIEIITNRLQGLANKLTEKQTKWTQIQKETSSLYENIIGLRSQSDLVVDEIKVIPHKTWWEELSGIMFMPKRG